MGVLQARAELLPSQCARAELLRARERVRIRAGISAERPLCGVRMRDSAVGGEDDGHNQAGEGWDGQQRQLLKNLHDKQIQLLNSPRKSPQRHALDSEVPQML